MFRGSAVHGHRADADLKQKGQPRVLAGDDLYRTILGNAMRLSFLLPVLYDCS